jgi:hypothetical protein
MLIYAGFQMHSFFLSQQDIDSQISQLKQAQQDALNPDDNKSLVKTSVVKPTVEARDTRSTNSRTSSGSKTGRKARSPDLRRGGEPLLQPKVDEYQAKIDTIKKHLQA